MAAFSAVESQLELKPPSRAVEDHDVVDGVVRDDREGTQRIWEPVSEQPSHPQHVVASGVDRPKTQDGMPGYHPPSPSAIPCTGSRRPVISTGVMANQRWR